MEKPNCSICSYMDWKTGFCNGVGEIPDFEPLECSWYAPGLLHKRKAYYMIQGTELMCFVAYSDTTEIQSEFHLYEFYTRSEELRYEKRMGDTWWIAG